jgi:DnaJ-class molecular chaperone
VTDERSTTREPGADDRPGSQSAENVCPRCAGTGRVPTGECSECGGKGIVIELVGDA